MSEMRGDRLRYALKAKTGTIQSTQRKDARVNLRDSCILSMPLHKMKPRNTQAMATALYKRLSGNDCWKPAASLKSVVINTSTLAYWSRPSCRVRLTGYKRAHRSANVLMIRRTLVLKSRKKVSNAADPKKHGFPRKTNCMIQVVAQALSKMKNSCKASLCLRLTPE